MNGYYIAGKLLATESNIAYQFLCRGALLFPEIRKLQIRSEKMFASTKIARG